MATGRQEQEYQPIDVERLESGMLVERALHVFLPANGRYVLLAKPLHPLEPSTLAKLKAFGKVFASGQPIDARFPELDASAQTVGQLCANDELAPFERGREIRRTTAWLVQAVLGPGRRDSDASLFFFRRAFGAPAPATLLHVSDVSVDAYERSVVLAGVAGVIALWLGYTDPSFLRQYFEAVFCSDVRDSGPVPGTLPADFRFESFGRAADELAEIVAHARLVIEGAAASAPQVSRVARKLARQFGALAKRQQGEGRAAA